MALTNCCCGCSLRTGTQIIVILSFIGALLSIGDAVYDLVMLNDGRREAKNGYTASYLSKPAANAFYAVGLIVNVVQLVLSGMFFVILDRPAVCAAWLYYNIFLYVLRLILVIGGFIALIVLSHVAFAFILIAVLAIPLAFQFYCLSVVKAYLGQLRDGTVAPEEGQVHSGSVVSWSVVQKHVQHGHPNGYGGAAIPYP